jgi:nicotinamide-nucleotide adenylyltransferase
LAQIRRALNDANNLTNIYIFVGSADKSGTKRNPIPIDVRLDLVKGSLEEALNPIHLNNVHVVPLNDLSDEANNTHSWGNYLYNKMCEYTGDTDFVFYYSDKPEIALSWFDSTTISHIYFRFLPRVENICATTVRISLARLDRLDRITLERDLPPHVYNQIDRLHNYIVSAR